MAGDHAAAGRVRILHPGPFAGGRYDSVDLADIEIAGAVGQEDRAGLAALHEQLEVAGQLLGDRDGSVFVALASADVEASGLQVEVAHVQVGQLGPSHSGHGQGVNQAAIAHVGARVDDLADFSRF